MANPQSVKRVVISLLKAVVLGLAVTFLIKGAMLIGIRDGIVAIKECAGKEERLIYSCYTGLVMDSLKTHGLIAALDKVVEIATTDSAYSKSCHQTMHDLGKEAYGIFKKNGKIQVNDKLSYCNFGFYHSFMEEMIKETGGVEKAKGFCESLDGNELFPNHATNCYHGIGHGMSSEPEEKGDAYKMSVKGLEVCKRLKIDNGYRRSCQTGVFNSIVWLYDDPRYLLKYPENPFTLCSVYPYDESEKNACYLEMATFLISLKDGDLEQELRLAIGVENNFRSETVKDVALYSVNLNKPGEILEACRMFTPKYIEGCIDGIAYGLKVFGSVNDEYSRAVDFYKHGNMNVGEKDLFLKRLLIADVNSEAEQKSVCEKLPSDMRIGPCTEKL